MLSGPKLVAEGAPAEEQIVLGWMMLDTHLLLVILPRDKYKACILEAQSLQLHRVAPYASSADSPVVDKLSHIAFLIPLAPHFFLHWLCTLVNCNRPQKQQITILRGVGLNCKLWEGFLQKASQEGILMSPIMVIRPTRLSMLDSCPFGIGGFLLEGRDWQVRIPASSPI